MERLSKRGAELTRQAWRDFGLYYISDNTSKEWHLHGSRLDLLGFADVLSAYAANPANAVPSRHEHLGPHMYLTLTSWPTAMLDERGLWGLPHDFGRLADHLRETIANAAPGQVLCVKERYTLAAEYTLCLHVETDRFDPASLDPQLAD